MRTTNVPTIVSVGEWDHMLAAAADIMRGPSDATRQRLGAFFAPERVDLEGLFAEGEVADARIDMPESGVVGWQPDPDTEVLVVRRARVDLALMEALPRLRHVQKLGDRRDTVDLTEADVRGISVEFVSRPALEATADHAVLLLMAALKELPRLDRVTRETVSTDVPPPAEGSTAYNWPQVTSGRTLYGSRVGIIGLGEVGQLVANRLRSFGAEVLWTDPGHHGRDRDVPGMTQLPLDELLAQSDAVTLHIPGTADNRHMVDAGFLAKMRSDAVLINVSRGGLVDEASLVRALDRGELRGAALDVHATEPILASSPVLNSDRIILTPHVAGGPRSLMRRELLDLAGGVKRAIEPSSVVAG